MALDSSFLVPPFVGVGNKGKHQEDDGGQTASNEDAAESNQQPSDDDLEDGELEDDEQEEEEVVVPVPEKSAEIKENPPVVPVAIPSLLDLKISPPRNGILGNSSGRKSSRWARKPVNRKRYAGREYGDSEDDDAEEMVVTKRSRKRKHDDRKSYGRFTDHDQNEDENGAEYSDISWFNSARGSRKKFGRLNQAPDDDSDSPLGPYDSPYASPPGPYDSPSASEDEISAVKGTESNSRRDQVVRDTDRRQPTDKETASDVCENTSEILDEKDKQPINNEFVPMFESDDNVQSQVAAESQSPRRSVPIDGRRQEREHRAKSTNNPYMGMRKGSRSPEPQHQKKRRLVDTPWDERPVCKFFYEGKCQKGGECQFKHSRHCLIKKPILCRFYNKSGHCSRGPECTYHHETWPCVLYHKKGGTGCPHGDDCKFSHAELTDETKELLEKAEEEQQQTIEESEPKKKSLLGDFPVPFTSDKRIPSLFDIDIHRPSLMPAGNRPMGPRNFAMKAATMNRFSQMGPRPRPPPRHIAMQLIRMQMAAFMRPRHGSIRGQFPFVPMYADPNLLNAFSQSEEYEEDEGVDWNEEECEENSENDASVSGDANVATPVSESLAVNNVEVQPIATSSASEMTVAAIATTSCTTAVPNTPLLPVPFGMTSVSAVVTAVSSQQSVPASSVVVAGVDLTQLPPVQRDLFLRIHQQQQQNNAISEHVAPITTSAINDSIVNIENKQQTVSSIAVTTQSSSSTSNISVSDILKVLVQQPPPANTSRMPLAPMFNINQVLSAINQVPGSAPGSLVASTEPRLVNREPTDSELEMNGVRTSIEYYLRPYDCATGTVVPAYMDLNDSAWDEDPRIQHWRRDVELGRMPRREERRKPAVVSTPGDAPPVKRDPRLRNDVTPVTSQLPMQQQQLHIQQMVQQMINNNQQQQQPPPSMGGFAPPMMHQMPVPPMLPGNIARVHLPPPVASVLPVVADVRVRPPGFPPVMPPGMAVPSMLGMVPPSSVASTIFPPLLSFNPSVPPPFMASPNSIPSGALPVNSLSVPTPSTTLMSTTVTCAQVVSVAPVADVQLRPTALNSVSSNLVDASTISPTYSDDVGEAKSMQAPKSAVDYRNDPRFRKRKNQSNDGVVKSTLASGNSSPSVRTGELSSDTTVGSLADSSSDKDVLLFQSPLAATSVNRSATSGYNRPPNKRYSELVEQNGQYQRRPTKSMVDVAVKKPGFNVQRQANVSDVSAVSSLTHSGNHYLPLMSSTDSLIGDTQLEGSVKDMFKTIDPTASPFC